ncbi:MAG: RluA family pseudouridine synthase [Actinomycetota bacterium]
MPAFQVRYEDDHLAVIAKAAGVVVHPAPGYRKPTLVDALQEVMPLAPSGGPGRPGVVHRLDKDTSGLMLVAKTDEALSGLTHAMKSHEVNRIYMALVWGTFALPTGRIEAAIGRSTKNPKQRSVKSEGKKAFTNFKVLEAFVDASLLEVKLETGRMHQIRVHLAHINHAVIGDSVYGRGTFQLARKLRLDRPFLHAESIEFDHPITRQIIKLTEPLPADLAAVLATIRAR